MKKSYIALSIIGLLLYGPYVHASFWYNYSWGFRQQIDFVNTKVSSTLTNFPALVAVTSTALGFTAFTNGHMGTSTGNDIVFTSSDGTTKLNHEIESYTSSTGALVAWVNVPTMTNAATTTIYMYYGNSSAANQQAVTSTWNSNFAAVYHMSQTATSTAKYLLDSTKDALNASSSGTAFPLPTSTIIDGGQNYDGVNDLSGAGNVLNFERTNTFSISMWHRRTTYPNTTYLVSKQITGGNSNGYNLNITSSSGNTSYAMTLRNSASSIMNATSGLITIDTNWHHVVFTYDGSSNATGTQFYENGVLLTRTGSSTLTSSITSVANFNIAGRSDGGGSAWFNGNLDEVNITSSTRTSGDILTTYNNQSSPSTFEVFGAEEKGLAGIQTKIGRLLIKLRRLIIRQSK